MGVCVWCWVRTWCDVWGVYGGVYMVVLVSHTGNMVKQILTWSSAWSMESMVALTIIVV